MNWRKGWAHIEHGRDPRKDRFWWAFDVFRTRKEARRCASIGEKIVRVEYRFPKGVNSSARSSKQVRG